MCKYKKLDKNYNNCRRIGKYYNYDRSNLNHVHDYAGRTELAGERLHGHGFSDATGKGILVGSGRHVHRYMNETTFDLEHDHRMMGITGIDISIRGGGHVHDEKSVTSFDRGHRHGVKFITSADKKTKRNDYSGIYGCWCDY